MVLKQTKRMAVLACLQALLIHSAMAYNKYNRLVDYRDRVTVVNSTDTSQVIYTIDLMSFPYMTDVSCCELIFPIGRESMI